MEKGLFNKFAGFTSNPEDQDFGDICRISRGTVIKGDISSAADIRLDGNVEGTVYSRRRVLVGENARFKGSVLCEELDLCGEFEGDAYVNDVLSLSSMSVVTGNVNVRKLQVELGARINGSCKMIDGPEFKKALSSKVKLDAPAAKEEESDMVSVIGTEQSETAEQN